MPAPLTEAPMLVRVLSVLPGVVLAATVTACETGILRGAVGRWIAARRHWLVPLALGLLAAGMSLPYMIYGVRYP